MQRLILDTNIVVSSLIQKSFPYLVVDYCLNNNALICLSNPILKEYFEVLNRPKFDRFPDFKTNVQFVLTRLQTYCEFFEPSKKLSLIADEPDNRLLELAQVSKADFIITGNTNDFTMKKFGTTQIVTAKGFWEHHKT